MRVTCIRYATHIGNQFKSHWLVKQKVKVRDTGAEAVLSSLGIDISNPNDLLRPSLNEEDFKPPVIQPSEKLPDCYMIHNKTQPIETLHQAQLLTNTVTFNHLPKSVLNKIEPQESDLHLLKNSLLKAHLLDAQQDLLPVKLDPINEPGYRPPRAYGSKVPRKIKSLMYSLFLQLYQSSPNQDKIVFQNLKVEVTVKHSGSLMNFQHQTDMVVLSRIPLTLDDIAEENFNPQDILMPDISPLSPFANIKISDNYSLKNNYCSVGGIFSPHTVFIDFVSIREPRSEKHFTCNSLLHSFSNAAAYAKELYGNQEGDLKTPVTLNLVHTNGCHIQFCRFQLNSLNLTGPTKNFFWYHPWETMFSSIKFLNAEPVVENINPAPVSIMRALI